MLSRSSVLILKWVFLMIIIFTKGNPPEEPIKCWNNLTNCTVTNSYGTFPDRSTCHAAEAAYPSSEEEIISIVADATRAKRKMRVATRYSHSIPKLVCPDGDDGLIIRSPEDGYAKVRTLQENGKCDGEMKAAKVSLGVLGVISQVTLKLQPMFKRTVTFVTKDDTNLSDQVATFGRQHEFADITWYPSQKRVVYRIDDRVSSNVSGNGVWDHPGFRAVPSLALFILRSTGSH
ncbi:hypothetical protein L1987_40267 [Smallanthus sonchifolius]|uniref:Uncharacterized protein n=1 Tax=Smallanthus sonchifolius TaxID=185202 RepID=A0ACB9GTM7_9ASTR|nr:hypothetical protein L1987_40267 [Smallanthus sonchifolius]